MSFCWKIVESSKNADTKVIFIRRDGLKCYKQKYFICININRCYLATFKDYLAHCIPSISSFFCLLIIFLKPIEGLFPSSNSLNAKKIKRSKRHGKPVNNEKNFANPT